MSTHYEETLQRGIDLIRGQMLKMAGLAERALQAGLKSLLKRNRQLAYSIILRDQYIDELEKEVDRLCLEFLVRQQPAGGHLRFVYAAIKINNELERIGDYAESIARQVLVVSAVEPQPLYSKLEKIANLAIPMFHNAIQAFVDQNAELAKSAMEMELQVDNIRNDIDGELVHLRQKGKLPLEALAPLMIITSRYERVADQACNICEEVLYMCTGQNIKHKGTEAFRILFVGDNNAGRSQMAEAIGNSLAQPKFIFSSAGIKPRPIDQRMVGFMAEKGIDISHHFSKSLDQIPNLEHYQVIVALSKKAEKAFPPRPTKTVSISWEGPSPTQAKGNEKEVKAAYEETFKFLENHIRDLVQAILGDETHPVGGSHD
jgi:phosphate transport system protein